MIKANYAQQNRNCVREWGAGFTNPLSQFKDVLFNNFYVPDTAQANRDKSGFNHGYNTHHSWNLPLKSGALGATGDVRGSGAIVATALAVKLAQADLTGSGDLDAIGSLIVQALADLTGSGEISDADLKAFLSAVAALTGSGGASGTRVGLGALISALTGSGTTATSVATGTGELDADLVVTGTGLTTGNVGQAVWSAIAAANNDPGTMGEKLNNAGGGSSPTDIAQGVWEYIIESGFEAQEVMRILSSVAAGDATGLEGATPLFKDLSGTKSRITSQYANGRRTITALDVT